MSLARFGDLSSFVKFVSFSAIGAATTYFLMNPRQKLPVNSSNLVVATGCDSGLGYSIAVHCHNSLNMSVVACVQHLNSKGAMMMKDLFATSKRFHIVELEVTQNMSIEKLQSFVNDLLEKNQELKLTALVNNCGIMCFGETEWQTNEIVEAQINVNLMGTIKVTKAFLPLVRQHKSRIINVTSHCGIRTLPGIPIYCATKAGLTSFTEALRLDMNKYGVEVINFIPGSFFRSSNIAAKQMKYATEMRASLSKEQTIFYGEYFERYYKYLESLSGEREPEMVDPNIIETFEEALLDNIPKTRYICEPLRYKFYHALFKITPQIITDILLHNFVMMPKYEPKPSSSTATL